MWIKTKSLQLCTQTFLKLDVNQSAYNTASMLMLSIFIQCALLLCKCKNTYIYLTNYMKHVCLKL